MISDKRCYLASNVSTSSYCNITHGCWSGVEWSGVECACPLGSRHRRKGKDPYGHIATPLEKENGRDTDSNALNRINDVGWCPAWEGSRSNQFFLWPITSSIEFVDLRGRVLGVRGVLFLKIGYLIIFRSYQSHTGLGSPGGAKPHSAPCFFLGKYLCGW